MKRCWAYQAIAGCRSAWVPCVREAEEGSRFCSRHGRAIEGAVLGALIHAEARDEAVTIYEELTPWNWERGNKCRLRGMERKERGVCNTEDTEIGARRSQRKDRKEEKIPVGGGE